MLLPEPSMTVVVDASLSSIDRVHEAFDELWRRHPRIGQVDRMAFETALIELTTNAVRSAPDSTIAGPAELRVVVGVTELSAEIIDQGPEFRGHLDHFALPGPLSESGRGLAVIDSLVDSFEYRRVAAGNSWTPAQNHWRIMRRLTEPLAP